ncbi:nuclear transport factor 2 family protein [Sphingopyxis sp.]|uniref:nuclear transport factor 2 family protein n=1 Tax=Sphingopyxis sp. TaxID=1908224 RepID=UPI002FCA3DDC
MSGSDNVAAARKFIELMVTGKDYDNWGPMIAEDAQFLKPFHPPGFPKKTAGRTDWVNTARESFKVIEEFHWIDLDLHNTDEPSVVYGTAKSTAKLSGGRTYENEYVLIVKFEGGLVKEFWEYLDPLPVMESFAKETDGAD